jgi:hypothetical protein
LNFREEMEGWETEMRVRLNKFNHKIRSKQITIEHNFIEYSYSYMFRPYGVIIIYICKKWELTYTMRYVYLF